MAEVTTNTEDLGVYGNHVEVAPGSTFEIGTREGAVAAVVGRHPLSENITPPGDIPAKTLAVRLLGTGRLDSSRQQVRIERRPDGVFFIENLSKKFPIVVTGVSGESRQLDQGRMALAVAPQELQRFKINWGLKGKTENQLSVEGISSGTDNSWSVLFRYNRRVHIP